MPRLEGEESERGKVPSSGGTKTRRGGRLIIYKRNIDKSDSYTGVSTSRSGSTFAQVQMNKIGSSCGNILLTLAAIH